MSDVNIIPLDSPVSKITTKNISSFSVMIRRLILNTSADLEISFFGDNGILVDFRVVTLTGADYSAWGNDDEYIINWVKSWIQANYVTN